MADLNSLLGDGTQSSYIHLKCGFAQCTLKPSRDAYLDIIHGNKIRSLFGSLPKIFLTNSISSGSLKAVEDTSAMENMQRSNKIQKSGLEYH
jgi:hypothetical protein